MVAPGSIVSLMNVVIGMDRLAEACCYMIALNSACRVTNVESEGTEMESSEAESSSEDSEG